MSVRGPYLKGEYGLGELRVAPVTPVIGAAVSGVDLRRPLAAAERVAIREALRRHKVLFFPAQTLSLPEFVQFGRGFGTLQSYAPTAPAEDRSSASHQDPYPEVHVFDYDESQRGREAFWHFDVLPSRTPAQASIVRARIVPEVGGDTLFCDLGSVYDSLPEASKAVLADAVAIYDLVFARRLARFRGKSEAEAMALSAEPLYEMPLVVARPHDGGKVVFVNPSFLVGIKGKSETESRAIADDLRARIARPEFQCRFRWRPDDLAFWDNRACLHYATNNYWPARRVMERLSVLEEADAVHPSLSPVRGADVREGIAR